MKQFSVIIPTMWKYGPFFSFLYKLLEHPTVGEVFIINNNVTNTPLLSQHSKLRMKNFPDNMMINPAWNYGVAQSNFDHLLILNDDVTFDTNVLYTVSEFLDKGKLLVINRPHPDDPPKDTSGGPKIVKYQPGHKLLHIGCMMFVHRKDWLPVPAGLNLYYGDSWLWDHMLKRYDENYLIEDLSLDTPMNNTTCGTLPDREHQYLKETELVIGFWDHFISQASQIK